MAKEVKVFNGITAGAMTVYTVPAGRVAKVVVSYFSQTNNPAYYSPRLSIGTLFVLGSIVEANPWLPKYDSSTTFSEDTLLFQNGGGTLIASVPKTYYLTPGQTVSFLAGSGTASTYSLLVVEEY